MDCPKCNSDMARLEFGTDITVMRCINCAGLYCEEGVLERMRSEWLTATVLDVGSAAMGRRQNEIGNICCPGCNSTMERAEDEKQSHITLDVCPSCHATFLDAGELTDLKRITLMDHVWRMLKVFGR
jgi:Zn-finger nucleic acid-binding protein